MSKLRPWGLACFNDVAAVVGQVNAMGALQDAIDNNAVIEAGESDVAAAIMWAGTNFGIEYWAKVHLKIRENKCKEGEQRMNNIGRTGNDGEHYDAENKYRKEIKKGVFVDVYDVLSAFNVANPATAHAVKKLLMPGQRGAKDTIQDLTEARNSIIRAIEMEELKNERLLHQTDC